MLMTQVHVMRMTRVHVMLITQVHVMLMTQVHVMLMMHYSYAPGILPGFAKHCILGNVYVARRC